jgi:ligand-binding sensor domain-containing protein/serine phosphatase RsbU (regulator of sigma subunit)
VLAAAAAVVATGSAQSLAQPAKPDEAAAPGQPLAVTIAPKPSSLRPRLRFQHLDRDRGLPQNTVSAVVQDRTGFIWLGTGDGLARYDGQRFLTFRHDPEDAGSLSASFVNALLVAKDGTLWVGTDGGGVNRYKPATASFDHFQPTGQPDALQSASITSLSEGPDGRIWIGTVGGGLAVLDPATSKVRTYSIEDGLPINVSAVLIGEDGTAWVGTASGMYRQDPKQKSFELLFHDQNELKAATITALHRDPGGDIWIGTDGAGLVRFSPASGKRQVFKADADNPERLTDDSITAVYQDHGGHLWVGTLKALHVLDPKSGRIERHPPDIADAMSLPGGTKAIFEDAAGVLWVGTLGGGAALLDPRSRYFQFYKTPGASALALKGNDLWIGTSEGACHYTGTLNLNGVCYDTGLPTSILIDHAGVVWVGTFNDGLLRFDPRSNNRWTVYQNDQGDPDTIAPGPVLNLYEDKAGAIWIGFLGGGLQRMIPSKAEFTQIALPTDTVYMIKADPRSDGFLWIGTVDRGILRYELDTGKFDEFKQSKEENKTDNAVVDFAFTGDGSVWLATFGGGLKRLDPASGKFTSYRRKEGMPSDTIYAILPDPEGHLWLSSAGGLARFEPKTGATQVFTAADGLQSDEFTQSQRVVTADGRFVFAGVNGINLFRPEDIQIDQRKPRLVLTAVRVENSDYTRQPDALKSLDLGYTDEIATIDFAALSFSGSERIRFQYKVEGLNDQWFDASSASVSLTGLADGDYTLLVRARDRHGVESAPISLAIVVAPPPWRTWWAYTGYGVLVLGIVFSIYRYQQARIERLKKLARLATVEKEFEVTAAVQSWFLPEAVTYSTGICDLVGFYRGAEKCSGDWWWYEDLGRGKLWVIVADVTGHGAGPAMLTAAVAMGLSVQSGDAREQVIERLMRVNREVLLRCKGKATMTMTALVLDQNSGQATVYGLGGLPALHMAPEGRHAVIGASGTPLGSVENLSVGERVINLGPGERILITTDGIVEATLDNGRPLGFRRFVNVMRDVRNLPLDAAAARIVTEVDQARGSKPQEDDFTFCILERRG